MIAYQQLLQWSLNEIKGLFTESELCLIADALNGILFQKWTIEPKTALSANLKDAVQSGELDSKWEVDRIAFYTKLDGLTNAHAAVLIDRIEAWWDDLDRQLNAESFAQHGLVSKAPPQSNTARIPSKED